MLQNTNDIQYANIGSIIYISKEQLRLTVSGFFFTL